MTSVEARVLTLRQPWAWAVVHGGKDVENRGWRTQYRGALLIHAGSAFEAEECETVCRLATQQPPPARDFVHGAIIGVVELVDCLQNSDSLWAAPGQWHWRLRGPRPFDPAVTCPGKLGLWRPPRGVDWGGGGDSAE
jgi:hypothetical protein